MCGINMEIFLFPFLILNIPDGRSAARPKRPRFSRFRSFHQQHLVAPSFSSEFLMIDPGLRQNLYLRGDWGQKVPTRKERNK